MKSSRFGLNIEEQLPQAESGHAVRVTGSPHVLIVDDALTVRVDLNEVFEKVGFSVTLSETKEEALARIRMRIFDLIVLDVLLPDGNGLDVLRVLRTMPKGGTTPVIVLSTEARATHYLAGLGAGADEYVGKPYDRAYLLRRAAELVVSGGADSRPAAPSPDRLEAASAKRVLVVGEDAEGRARLADALEASGYALSLAHSGEDVLSVLAVTRVDAVLIHCDVGLSSGIETCKQIRDHSAQRYVPVVVVSSAEADPAVRARAADAGADDFISGMNEPLLLKVRLRTILHRGLQHRESRQRMLSALFPEGGPRRSFG